MLLVSVIEIIVFVTDFVRSLCFKQLSSWQIPSEVAEVKKQQDADPLRTQSMSVSSTNVLTEKGSTPITLSTPAINTGGRDATVLRSPVVVGSSSALDLIKKKLQDSGVPPATSPSTALPGSVSSELNGLKLVDTTVKDPQNENSKEKPKDANGESNLSDSSSDSEDDDNGPSKEECIIQFKVSFLARFSCIGRSLGSFGRAKISLLIRKKF